MSSDLIRRAYRVLTPRLLLRPWQPDDGEALRRCMERNRDHLLPWMSWAAREPLPLEEKLDQILRWRSEFDGGREFVYGIFDRREEAILGGAGLHSRCGPGGLELGYWIDRDGEGKGLASEAASALIQVALVAYALSRVEVRVHPDNVRSLAIPERLGFTLEGLLRSRVTPEGEVGDFQSFSILKEELPESPAAQVQVEAFDVLGRRIL